MSFLRKLFHFCANNSVDTGIYSPSGEMGQVEGETQSGRPCLYTSFAMTPVRQQKCDICGEISWVPGRPRPILGIWKNQQVISMEEADEADILIDERMTSRERYLSIMGLNRKGSSL